MMFYSRRVHDLSRILKNDFESVGDFGNQLEIEHFFHRNIDNTLEWTTTWC